MFPGQYVYLPDGSTGQVLRLIDQAVTGVGQIPTPGTLYEVTIDGERVYVGPIPHGRPAGWTQQRHLDALHTAPRLLPACKGCTAMPGYPCRPGCPLDHAGRVPAPVTA
jgi:hypothetical protein